MNSIIDLLISQTPLIDVRAPCEFKQGALPGAVNLPLLEDSERAAVGLAYKTKGPEAALSVGQNLITANRRQEILQRWQAHINKFPSSQLYCFRGGLRSQLSQSALREIGLEIPILPGGFKAARRQLLERLQVIIQSEKFCVISGCTGSGKTRLLNALLAKVRLVDLEELARHRGSAFGQLLEAQPSQIDFESQLVLALERAHRAQLPGPIFVEDESRLIGRVDIPQILFSTLVQSPMIVLEESIESRCQLLMDLYLTKPDACETEILAQENNVLACLNNIQRRLGGLAHKEIGLLVKACFAEQIQTGRRQQHASWVSMLLERYYDPLYEQHIARSRSRIVLSSNATLAQASILNWIKLQAISPGILF